MIMTPEEILADLNTFSPGWAQMQGNLARWYLLGDKAKYHVAVNDDAEYYVDKEGFTATAWRGDTHQIAETPDDVSYKWPSQAVRALCDVLRYVLDEIVQASDEAQALRVLGEADAEADAYRRQGEATEEIHNLAAEKTVLEERLAVANKERDEARANRRASEVAELVHNLRAKNAALRNQIPQDPAEKESKP